LAQVFFCDSKLLGTMSSAVGGRLFQVNVDALQSAVTRSIQDGRHSVA
jgi:hypothetical protein